MEIENYLRPLAAVGPAMDLLVPLAQLSVECGGSDSMDQGALQAAENAQEVRVETRAVDTSPGGHDKAYRGIPVLVALAEILAV